MHPADLTVTLIQTDIRWENPAENRRLLTEKLAALSAPTDLILLPEMFTTGFTMEPEKVAEAPGEVTTSWLLEQAALKNAAIMGSIAVKENGRYFNRLLWAQPDRKLYTYDKRHLFRMAGENAIYSPGKSKTLINWRGWNILPLICYDLRFPVFSRYTAKQPYDLVLYVANWPEKRSAAWQTLLPARAVENLSYSIGLNRVGQDGKGIPYSGDSLICDPLGKITRLPPHTETAHTQTLNRELLERFRQQFPAYEDADAFELL